MRDTREIEVKDRRTRKRGVEREGKRITVITRYPEGEHCPLLTRHFIVILALLYSMLNSV